LVGLGLGFKTFSQRKYTLSAGSRITALSVGNLMKKGFLDASSIFSTYIIKNSINCRKFPNFLVNFFYFRNNFVFKLVQILPTYKPCQWIMVQPFQNVLDLKKQTNSTSLGFPGFSCTSPFSVPSMWLIDTISSRSGNKCIKTLKKAQILCITQHGL